jgi:hypothetical protein
MRRRDFLTLASAGGGGMLISTPFPAEAASQDANHSFPQKLEANVIILGGGLGGCATAIAACHNGLAQYPYIHESRRIKPVFTVLEEHVGTENQKLAAGAREDMEDVLTENPGKNRRDPGRIEK